MHRSRQSHNDRGDRLRDGADGLLDETGRSAVQLASLRIWRPDRQSGHEGRRPPKLGVPRLFLLARSDPAEGIPVGDRPAQQPGADHGKDGQREHGADDFESRNGERRAAARD
jgi:hypothetical protein